MTVVCNCAYRCTVKGCILRTPHTYTPVCDYPCMHTNGIRIAHCVPCDEHGNIIEETNEQEEK